MDIGSQGTYISRVFSRAVLEYLRTILVRAHCVYAPIGAYIFIKTQKYFITHCICSLFIIGTVFAIVNPVFAFKKI